MKRLLLAVAFVMVFSSSAFGQTYEKEAKVYYWKSVSEADTASSDKGQPIWFLQIYAKKGDYSAKSVLRAAKAPYNILKKRISYVRTKGSDIGWSCKTVSRVIIVLREGEPQSFRSILSCENYTRNYVMFPFLNDFFINECKID